MKQFFALIMLVFLLACDQRKGPDASSPENPFFTGLNEPVPYARVTPEDISEYAALILKDTEKALERIRSESSPGFTNIFVAFDDMINELIKASNNCYMLYWVSPDSLSRVRGLEGYQVLDSLQNSLTSDSSVYKQMVAFAGSGAYERLEGPRKNFVDDLMQLFEHAGVNLEPGRLERFRELRSEISDLSARYSTNMNTADEVLVLDEEGAAGLPEIFKKQYSEEGAGYRIPVIPATRRPVLNNATLEKTRKDYMIKYQNRASDRNPGILDDLVRKRYELARIMDYDSYASYSISRKMARDPDTVWAFLNDLIHLTGEKAGRDHELLKKQWNMETGAESAAPVHPWDIGYYRNQLLLKEYQVDHEKIREYLPMEQCLSGMMQIFQELLGLEIREVENPSVWHDDVLLYEVREDGALKGRFYLDLYPRPGKESWFYGVGLTPGKQKEQGYEVPVCLLLANFTRSTDSIPSLLSHAELNTLFHEFGHIMEAMSYNGEFAFQAGSREDFAESMAQLFENWTWDYGMLRKFARHYRTGEVLPRELFDRMLEAKNITSGLDAQVSLRNSVYDMMLYDAYDPDAPTPTDEIWREIDRKFAVPLYIEGTHPQASWIHINTHPTYYYGYLWAEVYAQDMFTLFRQNGLTDQDTGRRYRQLILSNGTQRDIVRAVEEFLGRPSDNRAYIRSLGLK